MGVDGNGSAQLLRTHQDDHQGDHQDYSNHDPRDCLSYHVQQSLVLVDCARRYLEHHHCRDLHCLSDSHDFAKDNRHVHHGQRSGHLHLHVCQSYATGLCPDDQVNHLQGSFHLDDRQDHTSYVSDGSSNVHLENFGWYYVVNQNVKQYLHQAIYHAKHLDHSSICASISATDHCQDVDVESEWRYVDQCDDNQAVHNRNSLDDALCSSLSATDHCQDLNIES